MNKTTTKNTLALCISILLCFIAFSQDIPTAIKSELAEYEKQIETHAKSGNKQLELEYLNKAAILCWNNQLYNKAADLFKRTSDLNTSQGNQNGIFLSSNYLGMIYNELQDYNAAIVYFKKSLEISKSINNKNNIASSLVNIAQTYQLLGSYKESNTSALEGINVAKEINNLKLLRSFYGILANNYQNIGDSKKSIEYFDLFSSIDKHLKNQEIKSIKQESDLKVTIAESEKKANTGKTRPTNR